MANETVKLTFTVEGAQALAILGKLNTGLDNTKKQTSKLSDAINNFKQHWIGATAALGGAILVIKDVTKAAMEDEKAQKTLAAAMRVAGTYTQSALNHNIKYASSLQKLTIYGDEAILGVQKMLTNFGVEGEMLDKLTKSTLDLAAAKGRDLSSAADLVAKTVGSSTNALSRYGIEVKGAVGSTERMQDAVNNISRIFGGSAQAEAQTYEGQMKQMANTLGDVKEIIGGALLPVFNNFFKIIKNIGESFIELNPNLRNGIVTFGLLGAAILVLTKVVMAFGITFSAAIWPITAVIAALTGIYLVITNWTKVKNFFIGVWESIKKAALVSWEAIKIGLFVASKYMLEAMNTFLMPVIITFNALIAVINKVAGTHFESISQMKENLAGWIETQIEASNQELEILMSKKASELEIETATGEAKTQMTQSELDKKAQMELLAAEQKKKMEADEKRRRDTLNKWLMESHKNLVTYLIGLDKFRAESFNTWQTFMMGAQTSKIKALWGIWKAMAITQTISDTYRAAVSAYASLAGIPLVGPILGAAAAGAAIAFGMEKVHLIAAQPPPAERGALVTGSSEGSIVRVGEKNKSELIVPFENEDVMSKVGGETHLHLHVDNLYGGEDIPMETIRALDKGFFKLKQDKSSLALA